MDILLMFKITAISFGCLLVIYSLLVNKHIKKMQQQQQEDHLLLAMLTSQVNRNILNLFSLKKQTRNILEQTTKTTNYLKRKRLRESNIANFLHLNDDQEFMEFVNLKLGGLASRLMEDYPKITIKNLKYIILFLLDIPNDEIKTLLEYSDSSFPTIRTRISHKLSLNSSADLNQFLYDYLKE